MFTDTAVCSSTTPICSAMFMNRLLKISSCTGSTLVPIAMREGRATTRSSTRSPRSVMVPCQPGSITVVAFGSTMTAGPATTVPGAMAVRSQNGVS